MLAWQHPLWLLAIPLAWLLVVWSVRRRPTLRFSSLALVQRRRSVVGLAAFVLAMFRRERRTDGDARKAA